MEALSQTENQALVTLFVKVAAKPGSQEKAERALLTDVNGARTEAGNLKMELYKAGNDRDSFYLFERWQSRAALEDHFKQPYTQGAFDLQANDLTEPIQMNYLEELWPVARPYEKETHRALTTLIVPFEARPECTEAFMAHFAKFVPVVREEPGNVEFHFHRVVGSETRFVLYERWEAQEYLDEHNRRPRTAAFVADITPLLTRAVVDFVLFAKDIS